MRLKCVSVGSQEVMLHREDCKLEVLSALPAGLTFSRLMQANRDFGVERVHIDFATAHAPQPHCCWKYTRMGRM